MSVTYTCTLNCCCYLDFYDRTVFNIFVKKNPAYLIELQKVSLDYKLIC